MGVFDDKRYEELDWISKAVEPIETPLQELLASLPGEFIIDFDLFLKMVGQSSSLSLSLSRVMHHLVNNSESAHRVDYDDAQRLQECFAIELDEHTYVDFESGIITGEIRLVKVKDSFEEKELQAAMGSKGLANMNSDLWHPNTTCGRLNEIVDMIGKCDAAFKTRSKRKKAHLIYRRMKTILTEGEWNIKSTELADKLCGWIGGYARSGNLACLTNFCKLKVMTHKGLPIYSMEEEV
jgi:hypothetical protein